MDQDSSNGAGPDKRNWRERLGIGAKELPKLSDEFRDDPQIAEAMAGEMYVGRTVCLRNTGSSTGFELP